MKTQFTTYKGSFPYFLITVIMMLSPVSGLKAQLGGTTWDASTQTTNSGFTNWGGGVISLTDTLTGSGACQASAVHETSGYNPTANFNQCFKVFFGCPGSDQIGTAGNPYTDLNGDGMAFSFWKNNATYTATNANTCGGGLGYHNALTGGDNDQKMITIEFDTYSSIGTDVDGQYGGGGPGSGNNDEISVHKNQDSGDDGLMAAAGHTVNAGNLEDGLQHDVCITYNATTHRLGVTIDAVSKLNYDMGAENMSAYFGAATLNYTWSAGKYGANNLQTIGPTGTNLFAWMGRNPCTNVLMPVTLIAFNGEKIDESVLLTWVTTSELNNDKFILQRSSDMAHWESLGEIDGAGNSSSILNYSFTDNTPLSGTSYYRLIQVDFDGTSVYSSIIIIQTQGESVSVGPNPFDDHLTVYTNIKGSVEVSIHDVVGKLVYHTNRAANNGAILMEPELANGAYVVTVQAGNFIEHHRVIKK